MSDLENRIEKLEKQTGAGGKQQVKLVVVTGESNYDGMDSKTRAEAIKSHKEAANAKVEAAIAEYIATHPECSEKDIDVITVTNENAKELTERVIAGERTGEL